MFFVGYVIGDFIKISGIVNRLGDYFRSFLLRSELPVKLLVTVVFLFCSGNQRFAESFPRMRNLKSALGAECDAFLAFCFGNINIVYTVLAAEKFDMVELAVHTLCKLRTDVLAVVIPCCDILKFVCGLTCADKPTAACAAVFLRFFVIKQLVGKCVHFITCKLIVRKQGEIIGKGTADFSFLT